MIVLLIVSAFAEPMNMMQENLNVENWASDTDACGWPGVFCLLDYSVVGITIVDQTFTGDLTEGIFPDLSKLKIFAISSGTLVDLTLPNDICQTKMITQIELNNINLGEFPSQLLECENLQFLQLSNCNMTGDFPDFSNLTSLRTINLSYNNLTGSLGTSLSELESLEFVDLVNNNLTGEIPNFNSNRLKVFDVRFNDFSGTVPNDLFTKSSIIHFGFDGNSNLELDSICQEKTFCIPF